MHLFRSQATIDIDVHTDLPDGASGHTDDDGVVTRELFTLKGADGAEKKLPIFMGPEDIRGIVSISTPPGKKIEHMGVKIELLGIIGACSAMCAPPPLRRSVGRVPLVSARRCALCFLLHAPPLTDACLATALALNAAELIYDRSATHEFISVVRELKEPSTLTTACRLPFEFCGVAKPYESYHGINARLRYVLRVTISRNYGNQVKEHELWVHNELDLPEINHSIKMEVGIEECLHIEFEYNKSKYHLKDIVLGKIYFLLVRIKIKHMELAIIRREQSGIAPNVLNESETLTKFEIMDGAPVRGESIPVRLFMSSFALTPTMRNVEKKFSVRYYLNLVLVDEEDRRYFKQQEIVLWRQTNA